MEKNGLAGGARIPRIIHYCWFGGKPMPDSLKMCMESWRKYCPDYEIIEWNESNYTTDNVYAREALASRSWAFYSDYARLDVVYKHGGIYLDVDVELVKSLDELLEHSCFLGMETSGYISTGLGFGAEQNNENIKMMLDEYENIHYILPDQSKDKMPCPTRNTRPFLKYGLDQTSNEIQVIHGAIIYPAEYFCPLDYATGEMRLTPNTISIHHFNASWKSKEEEKLHRINQFFLKKFGSSDGQILYRIVSLPYRVKRKLKEKGLFGTVQFALGKVLKKRNT